MFVYVCMYGGGGGGLVVICFFFRVRVELFGVGFWEFGIVYLCVCFYEELFVCLVLLFMLGI